MKRPSSFPSLPITAQEELLAFLQSANPGLLSRNLRRIFIDYCEHELEQGVPLFFDNFLFPFNCLLDFLDKAEEEHWGKMKKNLS